MITYSAIAAVVWFVMLIIIELLNTDDSYDNIDRIALLSLAAFGASIWPLTIPAIAILAVGYVMQKIAIVIGRAIRESMQ